MYTFEEIMPYIKDGKKVARESWNDISKTWADEDQPKISYIYRACQEFVWPPLDNPEHSYKSGAYESQEYVLLMKTKDNKIITYLPSFDDLFATDWGLTG